MNPAASAQPRDRVPSVPFAFALVALLAGCASTTPAPAPRLDGLRYALVVLGEEGEAVARAITSATACPSISIDGTLAAMDVRAQPAVVPARSMRSTAAGAKPSAFPVLTCEKRIPGGAARAAIDGRELPLPKVNPQRIVVIGDTGCRMASAGDAFQHCRDPEAWPFAAIAATAAATKPDLVIHVGDYLYRENPCPPANAGCAGSPWGYGWDAWEADLFAPAQTLLAAAPWVVIRGNHESCGRAGQGWWRFLDPRPLGARQDCIDPRDDPIGDYSEPYAVPLGGGADTQLIVFDSSLVGVTPLPATAPMYRNYRGQFERAFALGARKANTFFIAHHPVLGFAANPAQPEAPYPGNAGLQSVLQPLYPETLFPSNVQAVLGGHFHVFEAVSFATPQPAQFVSGNGGDWLDVPLPNPFPAGLSPAPGTLVAQIVAKSEFGFLTMERDGAHWNLIARDVRGTPMIACTLSGRKATCAPAGAQ